MNRAIKIQSIVLISVIETDFEENDFFAQKKIKTSNIKNKPKCAMTQRYLQKACYQESLCDD